MTFPRDIGAGAGEGSGALRGVTLPRNGLNRWRLSTRELVHLAVLGDSVVDSSIGSALAAPGGMTPQVRTGFEREAGVELHPGFTGVWRTSESPYDDTIGWWTKVGTTAAPAEAVALGPFSPSFGGAPNMLMLLQPADVATWHRPAGMTGITSVVLSWVDGPNLFGVPASAWSYRVDGGAWVDVAMSRPATNTLRRHTITGLSDPSTIDVRGGNAAGAQSLLWGLLGAEAYRGTTGIAVHNIGRGSAVVAGNFGAITGSTGTDRPSWHAWHDLVVPELTVVLVTNDTEPAQLDAFTAGMRTILTDIAGDVVVISPMEQDGRSSDYRATRTAVQRQLAAEYGAAHIDLGTRWGTYAQAVEAGFMSDADDFHPTALGGASIAAVIHRALRAA